ncbi:MAG: YbaN family protein [Anaerolineaceae bacterium]
MTAMGVSLTRLAISRSRLIRWSLMSAGFIFVAIALVGLFVPLLPTTDFLLLSALCFGRSSPAAYRWLTTNRLFGRYLRNYREHRGATLGTKIWSLATLWAGLAIAFYIVGNPWVGLALGAVGLGVSIHLLKLRTLRKADLRELEADRAR